MFRTPIAHIAALMLCCGMAHAKPADIAAQSLSATQSFSITHKSAESAMSDMEMPDMARMIIRAHTRTLGIHAPLSSAASGHDAAARSFIQGRVAALYEADLYTRTVIDGLIDAAADDTARAILREDLMPVVEESERLYFSALLELLNHGAVAKTGWFAASQFSPETEHQAGALLVTARHDRAFLAALQNRLQGLAASGDVSPETEATLARLLDQPQPTSARLGEMTH